MEDVAYSLSLSPDLCSHLQISQLRKQKEKEKKKRQKVARVVAFFFPHYYFHYLLVVIALLAFATFVSCSDSSGCSFQKASKSTRFYCLFAFACFKAARESQRGGGERWPAA